MSTEQNLQTVQNFTDNGWRETSHARRIEEIISTHNETHRLPDNWAYFTDEDGLYVTSKDEKEKNQKIYVTDVIQKTGYPESIEAEVLNKLDDWSKNSESGTAVWISPPYPGKYPC